MAEEEKKEEVLEFSLVRKEIPLKLKDAQGLLRNYTLRELQGDGRDAYLARASKRIKMNADGVGGQMRDFVGHQAELISVCLFDSSGELVPALEIQGWPSSLQAFLFDKANELCGLTKKAKEEEKNA